MAMNRRPKLVGINHIALEVGNIDEAIAFYGRIFEFKLRGRTKGAAFVDMGDQFIALMEGRSQPADDERHFGLVVDDRSSVRELAREAGAKMIAGDFLDFLDPWGNENPSRRIQGSAVHQDGRSLTRDGSPTPRQDHRGHAAAGRQRYHDWELTSAVQEKVNVRFGSKADMCSVRGDVR